MTSELPSHSTYLNPIENQYRFLFSKTFGGCEFYDCKGSSLHPTVLWMGFGLEVLTDMREKLWYLTQSQMTQSLRHLFCRNPVCRGHALTLMQKSQTYWLAGTVDTLTHGHTRIGEQVPESHPSFTRENSSKALDLLTPLLSFQAMIQTGLFHNKGSYPVPVPRHKQVGEGKTTQDTRKE